MTKAKVKETPNQLKKISRLPVPKVGTLPEDIRKYIAVCKEKLGLIPNVVQAFSFRPEKLRTFISKYNELMLGEETRLTRLEREMIAVVVSSYNHCVYCITSHSQAVREYSNDPVLGDILVTNYREAELTVRQRAMLDYAWKLTENPAETGSGDFETLLDSGFTEEEIFDITDVVAYFNYTNRMTHGLGIQPNKEYFSMNRVEE
ncbi:MAG: peroxidase-related enzyme [Pseudomonadota bacterium]|nr:peroxidase-related enzyme [Pseudomonadota bacterium]